MSAVLKNSKNFESFERNGFKGAWEEDPRRMCFTFSRYKFVAKMLTGLGEVLEVGYGDGTGAKIVSQHVGRVVGIDLDGDCDVHDMVQSPFGGVFDAAYALDVLEHINPEDEERFMSNISASVKQRGIVIIGIPSLESQPYKSDRSVGHINCKTEEGLRDLMRKFFSAVFMFGMNDETLHTGFGPMCHYRLCIGVK